MREKSIICPLCKKERSFHIPMLPYDKQIYEFCEDCKKKMLSTIDQQQGEEE